MNRIWMFRWIVLLLMFLPSLSCSSPDSKLSFISSKLKYSQSGAFFGAAVKVDVCYDQDQTLKLESAMKDIWTRFSDINNRLSVYDPKSDLNKINHSYPDAVSVGADTYGLIKNSIEYHSLSKGVFDITVGPLMKVWRESEKKDVLPSFEDLKKAKGVLGIQKIKLLADNKVQRLDPALSLNIDSIGDGYAADEAARILRREGFQDFLVDASGELFAGGRNCQGGLWRIGVLDPQNPEKILDVVEISDAAVSTSGNYERFYTIEGKRFSHIINPVTGFPANGIMSATVIAPTAEWADFWSTALCILKPDEGGTLTDSLGEGYASMVISDQGEGSVSKKFSRNYPRYLRP